MRSALAPRILPVVLANVTTHYPYHDSHLATAGDPPRDAAIAHPSFGNSFDWHSSVHSHWTAVQLLDHFAAHPARNEEQLAQLEGIVVEHLQRGKIEIETEYLRQHRTYERPYGWAWALMLAAAVHESSVPEILRCAPAIERLAQHVASAAVPWIEALPEPVRHGVHSNTPYALGLMHDAARALQFGDLQRTVEKRARVLFAGDEGWPERWERSGHDFLSPGLAEADLMRRVTSRDEFAKWFDAFLPALAPGARILEPVDVPDVADGQIVHLHGLNLSRAGALARIATAIDDTALFDCARRLYAASVDRAVEGDYLATHWLATFAWDAAASLER